MNHVARFEALINETKLDGRYRTFIELERIAGQFPSALWRRPGTDPRTVAVWCSNDYRGMGQRPEVLAAMRQTLDLSGAGTGGTRNISGTNRQHVELETELADLHGKEAALIFTSGWISNMTAPSTHGKVLPDCATFSDELNHNSMIDGIRRSGAVALMPPNLQASTADIAHPGYAIGFSAASIAAFATTLVAIPVRQAASVSPLPKELNTKGRRIP